ncbi:MAG: c-type cytochrome [Flavobacteriales bacterium]|nr:c-type cytochrome [Flavobacteriales bacterium]
MLPREQRNLLIIAEAKFRVAALILLFASVLTVWLLVDSEQSLETQVICGNVSMPDVALRRRAQADSIRTASLVEYFGSPVDLRNGERIFKGLCASCHKLDKHMTGPALKGILDRAPQPSLKWLRTFLTNEDSLVKAEDPYTLSMRRSWGCLWTHRADGMTEKQLIDLMAWVQGPVY